MEGNVEAAEVRPDLSKDTLDKTVFKDGDLFWDKVYRATKVMLSGLLFLLVLATGVVSKGAILILTWNIYTPSNATKPTLKALGGHFRYSRNSTNRHDTTGDFPETNLYFIWSLFLVVVTPYVFSITVNSWKLLSKKSDELRWIPMFIALVTAILHSIGLSICVFSLLPAFDPISGLLYSATITFVPTLVHLIFSDKTLRIKQTGSPNKIIWPFVGRITAFILSILSLIFWCVYAHSESNQSVSAARLLMFIMSPVLVSCGWWENFVPELLPNDTFEVAVPIQGTETSKLQTQRVPSSSNLGEGEDTLKSEEKSKYFKTFQRHLYVIKDQSYTGRYKIYLLVNICKVIITFSMLVGIHGPHILNFSHDTPEYPVQHMSNAFGSSWIYNGDTCGSRIPFIIAIVGIFTSVVCHRLSLAAVKIVAQVQSFALPLVMTTPVTVITVLIVSSQVREGQNVCNFPFPWWDVDGSAPYTSYMVVASMAGYLSLIMLTSHIWTNNIERMMKGNEIYLKPLYCGSFLDQSLLLNRRMEIQHPDKTTRKLDKTGNVNLERVPTSTLIRLKSISGDSIPMIYLCATMWHESETEMVQLLKSLFRMDKDQSDISRYKNHPDRYNLEAHIFFDDAFSKKCSCANEYVETFVTAMETLRRSYSSCNTPTTLSKTATPYGGQIKWTLPYGNKLIAHLKDEKKIRKKKRWSQVMYMYYFLSHKLSVNEADFVKLKEKAKNVFILALDGDVDFKPAAVKLLVDRMKRNEEVGAACGRIHPIGEGPMVWYQKFEYAVSHWLVKATEHVAGCVLCSPGCFSLFRGSSLMDDNVLKVYTTTSTEARHHIQYDQGEDRWLCTLLLKQGYKVDYCAASDAYTFAPEDFKVFYNQRRRWTPSTMANIMDLLSDWRVVTKRNNYVTLPYIGLQTFWFLSSLVTPGVLLLMITGAINLVYPKLSLTGSLFINLIPIVVFVLLCFFGNTEHQLNFAAGLSVVYSLVMMIVLIGLIKQSVDQGFCSITTPFFLSVCGIFIITGIMHPQEMLCLLHGLLFFIAIPSMSILLMIYSIINMNNVSWGTREAQQISAKGQNKSDINCVQAFLENFRCHTVPQTQNNEDVAKPPKESDEHAHSTQLCFDTYGTKKLGSKKEIEFWKWLIDTYLHPSGRCQNTEVKDGGDTSTAIETDMENGPDESGDKTPNEEKSCALQNTVGNITAEGSEVTKDNILGKEQKINKTLNETSELIKLKEDIKKKELELKHLRNKASLAFLLINGIFATIVFFLQQINEDDNGDLSIQLTCLDGRSLHLEPISMTFTLVFGILLSIQFVCMLVHRFKTFLQINSITRIRHHTDVDSLCLDIPDERQEEEGGHNGSFINPDGSGINGDGAGNELEMSETTETKRERKPKGKKGKKNKKKRKEENESNADTTLGNMQLEMSAPPVGHYRQSFTRSNTRTRKVSEDGQFPARIKDEKEHNELDTVDGRYSTMLVNANILPTLGKAPLPGIIGSDPLPRIPRKNNVENSSNSDIPPVQT